MSRILVTGAAGFIGSTLALRLAQDGHEVVGVDCFDSYYAPVLKKQNAKRLWKQAKILVHHLDLAIDPLHGILHKIDAVVHLAAQPGNDSNTPTDSYIKNNFYATAMLLEAIKAHCPEAFFLHGSTSSVYGAEATGSEDALPAPISPYGVTKLAAEAAVQSAQRRSELKAAVLRFFSVYGPQERPDKLFPKLLSALKHDKAFPLFEGSAQHRRSFTFISDIVDGITAALAKADEINGEVINLGSPHAHTTQEAIALAEKITGKQLKIKELPARPGDPLSTQANIAKAQRLLAYDPATSLEDGIRQTWAWIKSDKAL